MKSRNKRKYGGLDVCLHGSRQWHPTPVLSPGKSHRWRSLVGCSSWGREESDTTERLHFHALEKEMATHSCVLAWRIPGTGEPGGLPSMGSHRVGHDWSDLAAAAYHLAYGWCRADLPSSKCQGHQHLTEVYPVRFCHWIQREWYRDCGDVNNPGEENAWWYQCH